MLTLFEHKCGPLDQQQLQEVVAAIEAGQGNPIS